MIRIKYFNKKQFKRFYFFEDNCPKEVIDLFLSNKKEIDYDFFSKYYRFFPKTKRFWIAGKCIICKKSAKNHITNLKSRKLCNLRNKLICKKCIMKQVGQDRTWRLVNSKAQKIAQNRPKVKNKMSKSLKKVWKDPEISKRWRKNIEKSNKSLIKRKKNSISNKKLWQNEEYRKKVLDKRLKFCGISGIFKSKFSGKIRFLSSYELFFLFFKDLEKEKMKKCDFSVKYILNNKEKYYLPDYCNLENVIYEIKSSNSIYQENKELQAKNKAIKRYCKNKHYKFEFLTEKELAVIFEKHAKEKFEKLDFYRILFLLKKANKIFLNKLNYEVKKFNLQNEKLKTCESLIKKWNLLK